MVDFRECDRSALGHAWELAPEPLWHPSRNRVFTHRITLMCTRCTTRRIDGLNVYGEVEARWYDYPDGWSTRWKKMGGKRPLGEEIRLMMTQKRVERRRSG